jgi:hypothetical protein
MALISRYNVNKGEVSVWKDDVKAARIACKSIGIWTAYHPYTSAESNLFINLLGSSLGPENCPLSPTVPNRPRSCSWRCETRKAFTRTWTSFKTEIFMWRVVSLGMFLLSSTEEKMSDLHSVGSPLVSRFVLCRNERFCQKNILHHCT